MAPDDHATVAKSIQLRLLSKWDSLRTNYWFHPALMLVGAIMTAFFTNWMDERYSTKQIRGLGWIWIGSSEAARQILSTIASSMITIAGVTFSITIVALAQASSQFGPRLLRTFMRDLGNQLVLGTFVSTFIYCLLILREVHDLGGEVFVPHISVTVALALAVLSVAVLIYFIHHICDFVQAENLVATVGQEFIAAIKSSLPPKTDRVKGQSLELVEMNRPRILARTTGYIQAIDTASLAELCHKQGICLHLLQHAGDFMAEGTAIARVSNQVDEKITERIQSVFITGRRRTPIQDIDYQIHQLVEIAVRALSPGINDPFTAIACIDWLGAGLGQSLQREFPSGVINDSEGVQRVSLKTSSLNHMFGAAFNQIRQNGAIHVSVAIRMLEVFASLGQHADKDELEVIDFHATQTLVDALASARNAADQGEISERYKRFQCALSNEASGSSSAPQLSPP